MVNPVNVVNGAKSYSKSTFEIVQILKRKPSYHESIIEPLSFTLI